MAIWQADFYKYSSFNLNQNIDWELSICDDQAKIIFQTNCPQSQVNSSWLVAQLLPLIINERPEKIQVFRPQSLNLFTLAGKELGIPIEATRHTLALKKILTQNHPDWQNSLVLEQSPPQPLPENLWGEQWRFATFSAGELVNFFFDRPMPYLNLPEDLWPINLGIASHLNIPGVIIYGGKKSRYLAQWLDSINPANLNYIPTDVEQAGGLILESGLIDRWVLLTFKDAEMASNAKKFEPQKQESQGLHFLLIQPDDSGMTYTGFWLLKN